MTIQCNHLTKSYPQVNGSIDILNDVSFTVANGQSMAIVGKSGSGKSTLLHILGGLDTPDAGEVVINGSNIHSLDANALGRLRNAQIGFIYQFHHLLPEFTALENVAMPLWIRGESTQLSLDKAAAWLDNVGLSERAGHFHSQLSGGERQRVAIARAMVTEPSVILADEPTGNLDQATADNVLSLLLSLQQNNNTALVIVTHDNELARQLDLRVELNNGQLI